MTHSICVELGKSSRHPCHWNHLLSSTSLAPSKVSFFLGCWGQKSLEPGENVAREVRKHWLVQVRLPKKYQFPCHEKIFEKGVSCTECETIYHLGCIGMHAMFQGQDGRQSSLICYDCVK